MRVKRRHVIYLQGYDPRGLAEHSRFFRREYRRFCALYGLEGHIGKRTGTREGFSTRWNVNTRGRDWEVDVTYEFLRWEDIIRADFARPAWRKVAIALWTYAKLIFEGTLWRIARAAWRFMVFISYPYFVLLALVLLSILGGSAAAGLFTLVMEPPLPVLAGSVVGAGLLSYLIPKTETATYMLYLFADITSHYEYAHRKRPDWEARFELFAQHLVDSVRLSEADEVVIIGHSSGSFVGVDVVTRALTLDPEFGQHKPRVVFLTLGANLPTVGFQPGAGWFREKLAQLATDSSIDWIDCQSRKDVMNFYPFEPVRGHGIDVGDMQCNPQVVTVRFRDIIAPEHYAKFRWQFFRIHFQFLNANEQPAFYDYFMIVCGPFSLPLRMSRPADVLTAVSGDEESAKAAWQRLREEGEKGGRSTLSRFKLAEHGAGRISSKS